MCLEQRFRQLFAKSIGVTFQKPLLYEKTAENFKKTYGIELIGAPMVFENNGQIYYLHYGRGRIKDQIFEKAFYAPILESTKEHEFLHRLIPVKWFYRIVTKK